MYFFEVLSRKTCYCFFPHLLQNTESASIFAPQCLQNMESCKPSFTAWVAFVIAPLIISAASSAMRESSSLFSCWRFFSMTRHSCQGFSRTLCFWQGKQLQSKVCWLLSKYSALLYKGNWQTAETLTKQKTKKAPLVSRKGMSSHQLLQLEALKDSYLKKHFETHNMFF